MVKGCVKNNLGRKEGSIITLAQIASIVASFGTCLSSLVVLGTLIEINRQRKTVYRPDLFLTNNQPIYCYWDKNEEFKWATKDIFVEEENPWQLELIAFNIGLGAAKHINAKWDFNIRWFIDKINSFENSQKYKIIYRDDTLFSLSIYGTNFAYGFTDGDKIYGLDYVLPTQTQNIPSQIKIPISYFILTGILYEQMMYMGIDNCKMTPLPDLELGLSYYDIGNNPHTKDFRIEVEINEITRKKEMMTRFLSGQIQVKQVTKSLV